MWRERVGVGRLEWQRLQEVGKNLMEVLRDGKESS